MQVDDCSSIHSNDSDQSVHCNNSCVSIVKEKDTDELNGTTEVSPLTVNGSNECSNHSEVAGIDTKEESGVTETKMTVESVSMEEKILQNGDTDHIDKSANEEFVEEKEDGRGKEESKIEMSESDIEREVKKELKEAVEIRIPKVKSQKTSNDYNWNSEHSDQVKKDRPETPPLQKLMRQEFSPLKTNYTPTPPRKIKENSSSKEGYMSKLASVIVPSTTVPLRTASHPKQLLSHSIASLRSSSHKPVMDTKPLHSSLPLSSTRPYPSTKSMHLYQNQNSDQPLDLSKKTKDKDKEPQLRNNHEKHQHSPVKSMFENGISSTSLQSLQQKFGGDFHLRGLRKPTNYLMYGPEIPALHQALLHSAALPLPYHSFPISNGLFKFKPEHNSTNVRHRNSTPSPHKTKSEDGKPTKKEDSEKSMKREKCEQTESESNSVTPPVPEERQGEKYTNHLCMCGKSFDGLYSLSLHLQETGHLPARNKSVSLLEYPKLVRGQDMWLNQESEQTRRILRCIQCGESFKTLPMLTVHMMKTQHYTKIVSAEHTRRTHKCSAYCDKDQDKECVFKCKVCQDTFSDMEGLANHMLMSGHHKKQHSSHTTGPNDLRHRRKRYSFEDNYSPFGNPTVAALLDYKRKFIPDRVSPESYYDQESECNDNRITCENCGRRIETRFFVDHVRSCLGQKLSEEILHRERLRRDRYERLREDNDLKDDHLLVSPSKRRRTDSPSSQSLKSESSVKERNVKDRDFTNTQSGEGSDSMKKEVTDINVDGDIETSKDKLEDNEVGKEIKKEVVNENSSKDLDRINDETYNSLKEIQARVDSLNSSLNYNRKSDSGHKYDTDHDKDKCESKKSSLAGKSLDIIDPNAAVEENNSSSALSAMESFIKKSFSTKFDYKKGNIIINPNSSLDASVHPRPSSSAINPDSIDYFNRYRKLYSTFNIHNGFGLDFLDGQNTRHKAWREDTDNFLKEDSDSLKLNTIRDKAATSPRSENSQDNNDDDKNSVKSLQSDHSSSLDKNENLEKKYLTMPETDKTKTDKESSALDSLSSFVYGQPLTSEHPLDSLQRLITKADIPKLMASHGACAFKYLPPHLKLTQSNPDLTVPLNLTLKSNNGDSDDEEDRLRPDDDSLSDYEPVSSPTNSDGDSVEYRCAACSRRFATKGSYRYHLSRCHLSSVKRYGIKEAFNMSPYVYLPLDHTAKFSKYYEMAKELANKGN